ncbi:hypothetical protein [Bradyrhizobium sp. sBnM-33]|uniref:hypothetical protein n=1 Tax=Bradyrhizobium sp. sBnM-33 TaxID=2831780 RepID=UPI001BCB24A5|nr:hypothetical protein [Bradyrhizobium sp. sBnM-33]WOH53836.1 hypothetical protein RX328_18130 [Bradyrhizobium sp. sBnM-33]
MTAQDAANLLIAIAGTGTSGIESAAAIVERFSGLGYRRRADWRALINDETPAEMAKAIMERREVDLMTLPGMEGLRSDHSFRDGLTAFIEAVRQQRITFKKRDASDLARAYVSVEGQTFVRAGISISMADGTRADAWYEPSGKRAEYSDLHWRQTFSHRTISAVTNLLRPADVRSAKSKAA